MNDIAKAYIMSMIQQTREAEAAAQQAKRKAAALRIDSPCSKQPEMVAVHQKRYELETAIFALERAAFDIDPDEAAEDNAIWMLHCQAVEVAAHGRRFIGI